MWNDPVFKEWFDSRPPKIQELIKQFPPNKKYCVQNGSFPATIYSYDEEKNGDVSMKMNIHSPFMPRTVFGIKPNDIKEWVGESN
jgi:hypothetical protein